MILELNERSKAIFRQIVDTYVETGEPIGSRTIARRLDQSLSPASVRNVMADLEDAGLLYAPHTSAGRIPTEAGLRLYVDGLLETGAVGDEDRASIDQLCLGIDQSVDSLLREATGALSGLSQYAGLVLAPRVDQPFRQVEFVPLGHGRALVVVVSENGLVENRVIDISPDISAGTLVEAGNYLTARLGGRTLAGARTDIEREIREQRSQLDALAQNVVSAGLATWGGTTRDDEPVLIVRGQAHLLDDVTTLADLEHIRSLFEVLETKRTLLRLVDLVHEADGVQIYIGAQTALFGLSGCSVIVAPYVMSEEPRPSRIVGAIGVIGPTRMNYARIIPMVDYTARVVSRLLASANKG